MKELFEVSIPWQTCQHHWVADRMYYSKPLDAKFTYDRHCTICGTVETRSLPEFARLMGINLTSEEPVV